MSVSQLFSIANTYALLGWLAMVILYHREDFHKWIVAIVVLPLSVFYATLLIPSLGQMSSESFSTLENVMQLFTNDKAVLMGWIHYLAFDLLTGLSIAMSAKSYNINRWVMLPFWFFTLMAGPFGFALYYTFLMLKTKSLLPKIIC